MGATELPQVIRAIAASSYTITTGDFGALFTNRGGGALTLTLPAPSTITVGAWFEVFQIVAGDLVLSCAEGLAVLNNASADTFTAGQANEEIGNGYRIVNDGTSWLVFRFPAAEAVTTVVGDT